MPNRHLVFFPFRVQASSWHSTFCFQGLRKIWWKKYYLISPFKSSVSFSLVNSNQKFESVHPNWGSQVDWEKKIHSKRSHILRDVLPWSLQHVPGSKWSFAHRMPWQWKPLSKGITSKLHQSLRKNSKWHRGVPARNWARETKLWARRATVIPQYQIPSYLIFRSTWPVSASTFPKDSA